MGKGFNWLRESERKVVVCTKIGMGAETVTDCGGRAGCAAGGRGCVGVSSYCQILWGEAGQPSETAPCRRAVQLLHLLCQLLLEPPLFLILLCVCKLHHHWGGAALHEQNESAREKALKKGKLSI